MKRTSLLNNIKSFHIFLFSYVLLISCSGIETHKKEFLENKPVSNCGIKAHGMTRVGFDRLAVNGDEKCLQVTQTCLNGQWVGPVNFYDNCMDSSTRSCGGVPHGTTEYGYTDPIVHKPLKCFETSRTCLNGVWSGPMSLYQSCQEI